MNKTADLYRMVTDRHVCPFGIKAKDLLERHGFEVEDHLLTSREETDAFKREHDVETTPQAFLQGERIGGYDALLEHLGEDSGEHEGTTYRPVIAVFSGTALMATATSWRLTGGVSPAQVGWLFLSFTMCVLAIQKLMDLYSFTNQFVTYDLLARRWVRYAYAYPFLELFSGLAMIAGKPRGAGAAVALGIGTVGFASVFKAVYVDRRELKCACVGGGSDVPLGFISLTENAMMMAMGAAVFSGFASP